MDIIPVVTILILGIALGAALTDICWRRTLRRPTHKHTASGEVYVSYGDFYLAHCPPEFLPDEHHVVAYKNVKTGAGFVMPLSKFHQQFEELT